MRAPSFTMHQVLLCQVDFQFPCLLGFFPSNEFIAFKSIVRPRSTIVLASPLPDCNLLYFFFILLALSCVGVFARLNLTFFFFILGACLFLGPTVLVLVTVIFPGKLLLLIISYLATKDVPSGSLTRFGTARRPSTIFSLIFGFSYAYHQKMFLIKFYFTKKRSSSRCNKSERNFFTSLSFNVSSCFPTNMPNTLSYRLFSPHSNKSSSI